MLAEAVERPELVDRRARSLSVGVRMREIAYSDAERPEVAGEEAMTGKKPWWTT